MIPGLAALVTANVGTGIKGNTGISPGFDLGTFTQAMFSALRVLWHMLSQRRILILQREDLDHSAARKPVRTSFQVSWLWSQSWKVGPLEHEAARSLTQHLCSSLHTLLFLRGQCVTDVTVEGQETVLCTSWDIS